MNSNFEEKEILYIFAPDGLVAINETKNGLNKMYYISTDHLGSINLIVDGSNGNVVDDLSYDSWGRNRNPIDWSPSNITLSSITDRGYTSHEQLPSFGLINMNGRIYDPMTLGFLSPDPFVQNPSNSQNYNRFSYVLNNPLKYVDPSGYNYQYYIDGLPVSGRVFRMKMQGFYYEFDNNIDRLEFVRNSMDKSSQNYNYNISLMEKYLSKNDKKYGMYIQNNKPMTLSWEERKTMYELYGKVDSEYADKMINLYDNNVQSVLEFVPLYDFFWNFCLLNYNNSSSFEKIIDNTIMLPIDFLGASKDFIVNYKNMRKLNLVNSDKYFHSKANFEATKRGPGGEFFAIHFSNLREIFDQRIKGDSKYESFLDQEANIYGRIRGEEYRYYYGPINYQKFIPKYRKNYFSDEY